MKQPAGVTASFYPDPKFDRETPTLSKPYGSGLASVDEIKDYLQQLVVRSPGLAYMENIGVTKTRTYHSGTLFGYSRQEEGKGMDSSGTAW